MEVFTVMRNWENQDGCGTNVCGMFTDKSEAEAERCSMQKEADLRANSSCGIRETFTVAAGVV